ncbi:MAG: BON domain-containing protein [Bryobacteraceae bacterium]
MRGIRAAMLITAALACLTAGCAKKSASDQTLVSDIQAKLYADPTTKATSVNVAASKGVVTLSGDVPSPDVELQAMKIANGTAGVRRVNDQMKVNPSLAANQPAPVSAPPEPPPPNPAPEPAAPSATPRPAVPAAITIPAGERVSVRMIDSINSAHNTTGQVFRASLNAPLVSGRRVIVPAGAPATVLLAQAKDAGRIRGESGLEVRLSSLRYHGRSYPVDSSVIDEQGKARGKQTAVRTGIGAVAGAVIGAVAGGGKGAAIGSAAGGGAGFGYDVFTHGQQVKIPSETVLSFRLEAPLRVER